MFIWFPLRSHRKETEKGKIEKGRKRGSQGKSARFLCRQLRVLTGRWSSLSYAKTYIELIRFILKFHFSFALTMAAFLMVAIFIVLVVAAHTHTQVVNLVSGTSPSGVSFPPSVSHSISLSLLSSSSARHEPRGSLRRRLFQLFSVAHCHLIYFLCVFALGLFFFFCCSPPLKKEGGGGLGIASYLFNVTA